MADSPDDRSGIAGYRRTQQRYGAIHNDATPDDTESGDQFHTVGQIPDDSNLQSSTTCGGEPEPLIRTNTGGVDLNDSNAMAGGRAVGG